MRKLLLGVLIFWAAGLLSFAQEIKNPEGVPNLIISEMRWDRATRFYWEVTNMEDTAIDLSSFSLFFTTTGAEYTIDEVSGFMTWNYPFENAFRYKGTLGPKESYVIMLVNDRPAGDDYPFNLWSDHQDLLLPKADTFLHQQEQYSLEFLDAPHLQAFGRDSMTGPSQTSNGELMWGAGSWRTYLGLHLCYIPDSADVNIVIDALLANLDPDKGGVSATASSAAGVFDPTVSNLMIRKASVTKPQADWAKSAGVDAIDSEWLLIPINNLGVSGGDNLGGSVDRPLDRIPYTTVGVHGDYSIALTSEEVDVDMDAKTIAVPWGTMGNEGLISKIEFGDNMGWYYLENPEEFTDSMYTICMPGDKLNVYAAGNVREDAVFDILVQDPATDMAKVFDNRYLRYPIEEDPPEMVPTWTTTPYLTTDGEPGMDSITRVPFATRVDTLLKYLSKAPAAQWEIVWVDEVSRVDVKDGDILKVTAENGTTIKEYYISVRDFVKSDIAALASITWPDYPADDLIDWNQGDTLPGFSPNRLSYTVKLPYWTTEVPALIVTLEDPNSVLMQSRAVNLKGGNDMRTTVFTVNSESDSAEVAYSVLFEMDKPPELIQKYNGEPFISEILWRWYYGTSVVEICNPTDEILDLSRYMFTASNLTNPAEALVQNSDHSTEASFTNRFYNYVPGRVFQAKDTATWMTLGGILENDPTVNPIVQPKDVFVMASTHQTQGIEPGMPRYNEYVMEEAADVIFNTGLNPWNIFLQHYRYPTDVYGKNVFMWEIKNDSVLNGTKKLAVDPNDYELADIWGWNDPSNRKIADRQLGIPSNWEWKFYKKADFYQPATFMSEGFDSTAENSHWIAEDVTVTYDGDRESIVYTVGNHTLNPITEHISTVSSIFLLVSDGFEGSESIEGIDATATVSEMIELLTKADPDQMLVVTNSEGTEKGDDDVVAAGDKLSVTSSNGESTTVYDLTISELSGDAVLVAKNGSGLTVTVDGATGSVAGMAPDATIASVLDGLTKPGLAIMNIVDEGNNLVPLQMMNVDDLLVPTTIARGVLFEVIAQDGSSILYSLMPAAGDGAFVTSDFYMVNQEEGFIAELPVGIGVSGFLLNIFGSEGAVVNIIDKAGHIREMATMAYDDKLEVVSADGTMTKVYYLDFVDEAGMDRNSAPVLELDFAEKTMDVVETIIVKVTATDDDLPYPPALSYNWTVSAGDAANVTIATPTEAASDVNVNTIGTYVLTIEVNDGELVSTETVTLTVTWPVAVADLAAPSINMYPNPAKDLLNIELLNQSDLSGSLMIVDITGKAVMNKNIVSERMVLNVGDLEAGVYFVKVKTGDQSFIQKLTLVK